MKQDGGKRVVDQSSHSIRDVVQSGRTLALGARGCWFKSSHLDTLLQTVTIILLFISNIIRNLYCKLIKELYEF